MLYKECLKVRIKFNKCKFCRKIILLPIWWPSNNKCTNMELLFLIMSLYSIRLLLQIFCLSFSFFVTSYIFHILLCILYMSTNKIKLFKNNEVLDIGQIRLTCIHKCQCTQAIEGNDSLCHFNILLESKCTVVSTC